MSLDLPTPIAAYFAADRTDGDAVALCFVEGAIVKDEAQTHVGRAAIKKWKTETSAKYTYTSEPFAAARQGERIVVTSHLVGDFPGSPVNLRYFFVLAGDKIAELEVLP